MEKTGLDPVKYELLYQKLEAACNEAKDIVQYLSGSVIAREAGEVVSAFYLPESGEAASLACSILMHIMTTTRAIQYMYKQRYTEDIGINPDDQFISNDAYIGGMHIPDIVIVAPIFYGDEMVGWAASLAHTTETGGIEPGGMCPSATEACHDGIILPAIKLIERGNIRRDLMNLIQRPVRDPTSMEMDIKAKIAGNERLKLRVKELIDEYGVEFFKAATKQFVDDAEVQCRAKIKTLMPGIYRARVYTDVYYKRENRLAAIHVEVEVREEGEIIVRTPVVPPQIRAFDNAFFPAIESACFYHLLTAVFYDTMWNTGLGRIIRIEVPENCRINADPNRSVGYATVGIAGGAFSEALMKCVSELLYASGKYEDVMPNSTTVSLPFFGGINQFGLPRVQADMAVSTPGGGGRIGRDGIDGSVCGCTPGFNIADVEGEEILTAIVKLTHAYRPDSGGFGKYRGGNGLMDMLLIHGSNQVVAGSFGSGLRAPVGDGMFGGYPRAATRFDIMRNTDFYEVVKEGKPIPYEYDEIKKFLKGDGDFTGTPNFPTEPFKEGDILISSNTGGSGIGDPIERDPEAIVNDVKEHKATVEVSNHVYCVAINPESLEIDHEKTQRLRKTKRETRLKEGIPARKYIKELIERRNSRNLPAPAMGLHDEMLDFSDGYRELIKKEEQWVEKDLRPIGNLKIEKLILPLTLYLNIVEDNDGNKVVVCSKCGFAYCGVEENWKGCCLIYERDPSDLRPESSAHDKDWCIYREFYCPGCGTQIEVEACPPGAPIMPVSRVKI